jgi:hypothetical protein
VVYDLDVREEKDYLRIDITGQRTKDTIKSVTKEIYEAFKTFKGKKILVDVSKFEEHINIIDIFSLLTSDLPNIIKGKIDKVAIIEPGGNEDDKQFFENVARNRGHNLKIFDTEEDALEWL